MMLDIQYIHVCIRIFLSIYVSMYMYLYIYLSIYLSIYLCIYVSVYLCIYVSTLTLQRPFIFGVFQEKKHVFPKVLVLKLSTVSCMLVMVTHGGGLKLRKIKKCATLPTWNSLLQVLFWFWMIEGAGEKISKALVLVYVWCHGFDLPCFDSWARFALSFLHAWG